MLESSPLKVKDGRLVKHQVKLTLSDLELGILCFNSLVDVSQHLDQDLEGIESKRILLLRSDDILVLALEEFALSYL